MTFSLKKLIYRSPLRSALRRARNAWLHHRAEPFAEPDLPVLVMTGRLVARKRVDQLFEAVSLLDREGLRTNVLLIGSGPEEDNLKALAESMGIAGRVVFYGACYEEETLGLLISSSDLCVSPGQIGLTCMHCMSYGTPAVTHSDPDTQAPEYEAIIPGVTGDLFERDNTTDLADTISNMLNDPRPRSEIREACYRIIDLYYNPHFQLAVINTAVKGFSSSQAPRGNTLYPSLFSEDAS